MRADGRPGRRRDWAVTLVVVAALGLGAWAYLTSRGDDSGALWSRLPGGTDVAPATDARYLSECGDCHFAYQPGLLPARGWDRIMATLDDHFGDNAELDPEARTAITEYLIQNAADTSHLRRPAQIVRSIPARDTPLRISEVPYIKDAHKDIPARLVTGNAKVESASHCDACHVQADKGYYNDSNVVIPGHGKWTD
ncbi:MAG: diheme cytochrome c [Nitrospirae bacterium]|nr:diheme cytochrome c [Nitrospirota bacterium]